MAATRWLDAEEQMTWRLFMLATKQLWAQLERDVDQGTEVPSAHYETLVRLSEAPERRLRLSDLADQAQSSRSRLSHSLARLEALGWIRREPCESDRRGTYAVLTDEGLGVLKAAAPVHVESVRTHIFDALDSDQLEQLRAISRRLLDHLGKCGDAAPAIREMMGGLGLCPSER